MEILRDQYLDYMTFRAVERPLFVELFGPLVGLEQEWRAQGATEAEIDLTAFGFDHVRRHTVQVNLGLAGGLREQTLEETADYRIQIDQYGRRVKLFKQAATIALPLDYPVTDMETWLKIRPRYTYSDGRFASGWREAARKAQGEGALIVVGMPGAFDEPRQLLGEEALCMAYYDQPELISDMLDTFGNTAERVLDRVSREVQVDLLSVHEDLAGKSGSLIGPSQIHDFVSPYYHRIWDMLEARGARIFQQDSDGNLNAVIPAFLDCGLNCIYPMEPAAGMDIVALRQKYGARLAMLGGIDKHVLRKGKTEIDWELEYKLQPGMHCGGTVFGLDHRIPNGTPIDNYRYYVTRAREKLGLDLNPPPGWGRMAF